MKLQPKQALLNSRVDVLVFKLIIICSVYFSGLLACPLGACYRLWLGVAGMQEVGPTEPNPVGDGVRRPVRAFVSYARDDEAHVNRVREFWWFLCQHGIDAHLDLLAGEQRQDWAAWSAHEVEAADRVLVIPSPEYRRRADSKEIPTEQHAGSPSVHYEAGLIRDRFYADPQAGLQAVIPVVLPGCSAADIPLWLGRAATMHYVVTECTTAGAEKLLRLLTGQPYEVKPPLGTVPTLLPRTTPDDASLAPVSAGPDLGELEGDDEILSVLGEVSNALAAIRPSSAWTSTRWMVESTSLRLRINDLDSHFQQGPHERGSSARALRQAIRLNSKILHVKGLCKNIKTSLNYLQGDSFPTEVRARQLRVFITSSTSLQRAILQIQNIVKPADYEQENG